MKYMYLPLALFAALILSACTQPTEEAPAAEEQLTMDTPEKRLSYGIAYGLGERLKADGVPVDVAAFSAGLEHAFNGSDRLLSQDEIAQEMQAFQQSQGARQKEEMEAAAGKNAEAGAAFLVANAKEDDVVVLESGLQYRVVEKGDGPGPTPADTVEVHYRGTLIDGTEFDSSYSRGETVSFGVTQVIAGWTEALQLMSEGAKWQLFIPSELAYGPGGAGGDIGPNSTLIFDVELIKIVPVAGADAAAPATAPAN
jgi:FKBP-type peptidyl-prolyl cis-trans isomerase